MTEFDDCSFKEYLSFEEEKRETYKMFGLKAKPNGYGLTTALDWEWGRVKDVQVLINKSSLNYSEMIEILTLASKKTHDEILSERWDRVFKLYNFVVKEIEHINELEKQLAYDPEPDEVSAGIDAFNEMGYFVTLNRLAGGDPLKYKAILEIGYADIFATLKLNNIDMQFQRNLMRQRERKYNHA